MSLNNGDTAFYQSRSGERIKVLVHGRTPKRVRVIYALDGGKGGYVARYVAESKLERAGGAARCR